MRAFADSGAIPLALAVALLGAPGPACGGDDDTSRSDLAGADSGDSIQFGEIADSAATDSAAPDAPDSDASCSADPGGFRCPCEDNAECNSGFCIPVREGGKACTQYCTTSCPDGWDCSLIQFPGSDPTFLCIEVGLNLCRPCTSDAQCQAGTIGANGDRCITRGDAAGAFCGIACAEDDDCPGGYECRESIALEGQASVRQCVPIADRECTCSQRAIDEGATTACHDHACAGVRTCGDDGLTACNAPTWAAETCNGRDDDCSGATDEGFTDTDHDAQADCVDLDDDDDSVPDTTDDCPLVPDPGQENHDTDTLGDACDDDDDDSIDDPDDDCPSSPTPAGRTPTATASATPATTSPSRRPPSGPPSPASPLPQDPTPLVSGHAERSTTITVYADEHCEGDPIGSATTNAAGTFSGPVTVPENQTSTLYGTATDGAGNVSPCSDAPLVYTHDALPPATPFLLMTAPTSPSRTTTTPASSARSSSASGIVVRIYRGTARRGPARRHHRGARPLRLGRRPRRRHLRDPGPRPGQRRHLLRRRRRRPGRQRLGLLQRPRLRPRRHRAARPHHRRLDPALAVERQHHPRARRLRRDRRHRPRLLRQRLLRPRPRHRERHRRRLHRRRPGPGRGHHHLLRDRHRPGRQHLGLLARLRLRPQHPRARPARHHRLGARLAVAHQHHPAAQARPASAPAAPCASTPSPTAAAPSSPRRPPPAAPSPPPSSRAPTTPPPSAPTRATPPATSRPAPSPSSIPTTPAPPTRPSSPPPIRRRPRPPSSTRSSSARARPMPTSPSMAAPTASARSSPRSTPTAPAPSRPRSPSSPTPPPISPRPPPTWPATPPPAPPR
ncbi:MAG: Ig-like domain-containing protein [Myxococcota bacterium]